MSAHSEVPGASRNHEITAAVWASLSYEQRARYMVEHWVDDPILNRLRPVADEAAQRFIETFKINPDEETVAVVQSSQLVWTIARLHSCPWPASESAPDDEFYRRFSAYPSGEQFMGWEIWHWLLHDEEIRYEQTWRAILLNLLEWPEQKVRTFLPAHRVSLGKGKFKPYKDLQTGEADYLTSFAEPPLHSLTRVIRRSVLGDRHNCVSDRNFGMRIYDILTGFDERYDMYPETNPVLNWAEARRRFQEVVEEFLVEPLP